MSVRDMWEIIRKKPKNNLHGDFFCTYLSHGKNPPFLESFPGKRVGSLKGHFYESPASFPIRSEKGV